jgi:hypothetical protein
VKAARKLRPKLFAVASVILVGAVASATAGSYGTAPGSTPSQIRYLSQGASLSLITPDGIRMGDSPQK